MRRVMVLAVGMLSMAACSSTGRHAEESVSPAEGLHFVTEYLSGINQAGSKAAPWYRTLDELLPNVEYVAPDGTSKRLSDLAAVGRFVRLAKGKGFVVPGDDAPDGQPVDFDDSSAKYRSVHAEFEVEKVIAGTAPTSATVRIALPLYEKGDFDRFDAGLRALGRTVVFLKASSALTTYDPSLYVVVQNHVLMAPVAADGSLGLPFLTDRERAALLGPTARTVSDLERGAATPRRVLLTRGSGGLERATA